MASCRTQPNHNRGERRGRPEHRPVVEILNSNPVLAVHDLEWSAAWYRDVLGPSTLALRY